MRASLPRLKGSWMTRVQDSCRDSVSGRHTVFAVVGGPTPWTVTSKTQPERIRRAGISLKAHAQHSRHLVSLHCRPNE